jgi:aminoglycoside phosphotransferase
MEGDVLSIEAIIGYASRIIGPCELEEDQSGEHRASSVLRLRGADGGHWVVKRHRGRARYEAELAAYQKWAPAMGEYAPRLRGYDEEGRLLVLSALSGEAVGPGDAESHRRAGAALRLLHEAEPAKPWDEFQLTKLAEFEDLAPRASQLLPVEVVDFVLTRIFALAELDRAPARVPCHGDYTPRNWLVDGDRLRVLDFGLARTDVWVGDLAQLDSGAWRGRPELRAAFLQGYGRTPDAEDEVVLGVCAALTATWQVVRARESGQAALEGENRRILGEFMKRRW